MTKEPWMLSRLKQSRCDVGETDGRAKWQEVDEMDVMDSPRSVTCGSQSRDSANFVAQSTPLLFQEAPTNVTSVAVNDNGSDHQCFILFA